MTTPALSHFLSRHKATCAVYVATHEKHTAAARYCSCGRDEAVKELEALKKKLIEQKELFA